MNFEWDENKAAANLEKHGIRLSDAAAAFSNPNGVEEYDFEHSITEHRYNLIGLAGGELLFVVFTLPSEKVTRLVSARLADEIEREVYEEAILS